LSEALQIAQQQDLDLVEVAPLASPPVCRIMDYGKFKFDEAQRAKESRRRANNFGIKEMKYRPKIGNGDFDTKTRQVVKFLHEGHKVKITVMFRGREVFHSELGRKILDRIAEQVDGMARIESEARLDGKNMVMVLAPDRRALQATAAKAQNEAAGEQAGGAAAAPAPAAPAAPAVPAATAGPAPAAPAAPAVPAATAAPPAAPAAPAVPAAPPAAPAVPAATAPAATAAPAAAPATAAPAGGASPPAAPATGAPPAAPATPAATQEAAAEVTRAPVGNGEAPASSPADAGSSVAGSSAESNGADAATSETTATKATKG
jgi:translation initiation factor IF-3